jgi:hypothetical protein
MILAAFLAVMTVPAKAQVSLDDLLGAVTEVLSGNGGELQDSARMVSVFSAKKQATAEMLIGTWVYQEPAIVFTSSNLMGKAAAKVAAGKAEGMLEKYLEDMGIKAGALVISFAPDGTLTETLGQQQATGTWMMDGHLLRVTIGDIEALPLTTQLSGKELKVVTDATKLMELFKSFSQKSTDSDLKAVAALLGSFNGFFAGFSLHRK